MLDPADFSAIETLRNGRKIEIRGQRQQDRKDLEAAIVRMRLVSLSSFLRRQASWTSFPCPTRFPPTSSPL